MHQQHQLSDPSVFAPGTVEPLGSAAYQAATNGRHPLVAEIERLQDEVSAANDKIKNLEIALQSSREIGTAIGILMCQRHVTADRAFEMLRTASQHKHRKLRDIATDVVFTGALDA